MSPVWAVFLLCSLLTPSQGRLITPVHIQEDVADFKHLLAKRDLQKLQGGLLGGKLFGGLHKKGGPLGGLLGRNGAVGGVLGEEGVLGGLLGKNGAVGGLLGADGVLGGLLGQDGAVGSLLGEDGVLGGLLGRDGLLGGNGLLGDLLGAEGAVGGLLGGDGVLGGLLGGDGVLGGLLDRDGVLGGVLGKDGLLDALLGKDGLVDSLLDAVLEILIGKGGILGKDGLVGSLLHGNGGDDTGPRILNNTLPKISLRSLPGFGHQVGFNTQLLVEDTSVSGRGLCVLVEADVNMLVQDKWASLQSNKDCKVVDINIRLRPQVPLLDQPLKSRLSDILSEVGCDILNARLNVVSSLLSSGTPTLPLGALGDLPPFSILSEDSVQLDLNLLSEDKQGNAVAPTQAPPLPATLLLATGQPPQLSLSQQSLSTLLEPAQGAFNLNITSAMAGHDVNFQGQVSGSPSLSPLSTSALLPLNPQLARVLPGNLPLELRVSLAKEPLVSVRDRRATVTLKASIDVVSPALQSAQKPLFSLDTDIVLNIIPSVFNGKLRTSLALDSINLTRAPLSLGPLSVSPLTEWLRQILTVAYIPAVNDALVRVSVPLPNVLSTNLRNAQVDIADANEFSDQTALKNFCSSGALSQLRV